MMTKARRLFVFYEGPGVQTSIAFHTRQFVVIFSKNKWVKSFSLPLLPPVLVGLGITLLFYGLILTGPLDYALLRRYCLCHEVAVVTVGLFWVSATAMTFKLTQVRRQTGLHRAGLSQLASILEEVPSDLREGRAAWLAKMWQASATPIWQSFLGQRVNLVLARQIKRGNTKGLDEDLRQLAEQDADRHHDSYGLIRIAIWAMPMLGFLGTVIGIAGTLGEIDSEMLASGSQEAMNRITAGLYVAFDKTAIALALTMAAMFLQFGVQRIESGLLTQIDEGVAENLMGFLAEEEAPKFSEPTHELIEKLTDRLASVVSDVVRQQAELWRSTIEDAQQCWAESTSNSEKVLRESLVGAIDHSLQKHAEYLEQAESIGAEQIDERWQQWQTTLSEHARMILDYQREQADQAKALCGLMEKVGELNQLEIALDRNVARIADFDRFHEAAVCLTEAVAYIGTQMERNGMIGKTARKKSDPAILSFPDQGASNQTRGRAA